MKCNIIATCGVICCAISAVNLLQLLQCNSCSTVDSFWRVSAWCLIDPGYCHDYIDGIAIDKNHFLSPYSTTAFQLVQYMCNLWVRSPSPRKVDQFWVLLSTTEKKDIEKYTFQDAKKSMDKGRMNHAR